MAEEDPGQVEEAAAPEDPMPMTQLERLAYWSPAALFAFAMAFLLITIILSPGSDRQRRKEPSDYYIPALEALGQVRQPTRPLAPEERERNLLVAQVNLNRLVYHYGEVLDELEQQLINPYLLLAEADRLLLDYTIVPRRREELLEETLHAYEMAELLETREREEHARILWERQYATTDENIPGQPPQLEVRRQRRLEYIKYHRAIVNLELGRQTVAREELEDLRRRFYLEEMERLRREKEGLESATGERTYRPVDYELLPADKVTLHYHLARAYDRSGNDELAEREYRIFLLQSARSRELFAAKQRLAEISFQRGEDLQTEADFYIGETRAQALREAEAQYRAAAEIYTEIVEDSAPEEFLRNAYFRGGMAYLAVAGSMDVGQETSWDFIGRKGRWLQGRIEALTGSGLPPRAEQVPAVLGSTMLQDSLAAPSLLGTPLRFILGGGMVLATRQRTTLKDERDALLQRARSFFEAASSGSGSRYLAESRVMIGRSLLAEGRMDEGRRIFSHAMEAYPSPAIRAGALWGISRSYMLDGRLDEAWQAFTRLPSAADLPETPLLDVAAVLRQGQRLGRMYVERADGLTYPEEWVSLSAPGSMQWLEALRRAKEKRRVLARATEIYQALLSRYDPEGIDIPLNIADLYARRAELISQRPFGSEDEKKEARRLRILAADTYYQVAKNSPSAPNDEDTLLKAGDLFFAAQAYERAIESLRMFVERHERSERTSRVRNLLGRGYQRLGMFRRAEGVFRKNASESATPEGFKSLYNLGVNYLDWAMIEEDRAHLGGPSSDLVMRADDYMKPEDFFFTNNDILDWSQFITRLRAQGTASADSPGRHIWRLMDDDITNILQGGVVAQNIDEEMQQVLLEELNNLLTQPNIYDPVAWRDVPFPDEAVTLVRRGVEALSSVEVIRLNRLLFNAAFPESIDRGRILAREGELPQTAREVFEHIRRLPMLSPDSRPWRWATFSLGETFYEIARNLQLQKNMPQVAEYGAEAGVQPVADRDENNGTPQSEEVIHYFHRAEAMLNEALNRYVLYDPVRHPYGVSKEQQPEDYMDIKRRRFRATYTLALTYQELAQPRRAQRLFGQLLDDARYGPEVFMDGNNPLPVLQRMQRNAYLFLGLSLHRTRDYEAAYAVFERAHDRLKTSESPYILYMMGESLREMGRLVEARNKYIQARHTALSAPPPEEGTFSTDYGKEFWAEINEQRIADLEYLDMARSETGR